MTDDAKVEQVAVFLVTFYANEEEHLNKKVLSLFFLFYSKMSFHLL